MILVSAATAAWAPLIRLRAGGGVTNLYPGPAHLLNGFHPSTRSGPRHQDRSRLSLTTASAGRITLPRTADQQARVGAQVAQGRGSAIDLAGLAAGDVIAFQNDPAQPGVYSHIAIYVGGGQIVAAPHSGDHVKIQPVTIPYWTSTVWSVRRYG